MTAAIPGPVVGPALVDHLRFGRAGEEPPADQAGTPDGPPAAESVPARQ
jgi:hypothetical protein